MKHRFTKGNAWLGAAVGLAVWFLMEQVGILEAISLLVARHW